MANQVDFKILPSDQFNVYSPQTRSDKIITYFTLLSKLRGDILAVGQEDDPNDIVSAFYSSVGGTQTLHLVKADGSEITASVPEPTVGTVTSVDLTASTGISVSGGPITTSGSITVTNTAPDQVVVLTGAGTTSISGTYPSFTITSNDQFVGTVTSVGLTMPAAFSVANSPVTASGTLAVTAAGLSSQYIRGDGQLANFPTPGGGGSSVNYYLNGSVSQGTFGGDTYYELSKTPIAGAGTNFTRAHGSGDGYIASFITDANDPDQINIPGGNWNLEFYFNSSSSGGSPAFYGELYKVSVSNVFTLIASGSVNPESITGGTTIDQYYTSIAVPQTALLSTDRLAIRVYVIVSGKNITLHTENSNFSEVITTFSTGLNSLNGLSDQVQYFAVGTSGTDFAISSSVDTHTFNLPTASATNRGALSSADWTTFNSKEPALTKGNLTEATSAVLTITGGTGAVIGTGTTIQVAQSGASTSGFLSSTDWNTFNGKQSALTFSAPLVNTSGTVSIPAATSLVDGYLSAANFVTFNGKQDALTLTTTGSTGAATLIGATLNIPNYADQFVGTVTSVNMSVPTGFAISGNPITTSGTLAVAFDTGYSLPTNASQANWDTAYNNSITAFSYNTSTGVLTLTQQDAGTLTATITLAPFDTDDLAEGATNKYDKTVALTGAGTTTITGTYPSFTITSNDEFDGTVTSVATTAPITGGTITTTGTIGITQSGAATDGYLSSTDWNTFNSKEPSLTKGNLTEATSSVLTITGGTNAVIGTGTTIQVSQAGASSNGYLSSTDWNTFNGKQNAITLTTTGTSGVATLIGATLNIPDYTEQYSGTVTSVSTTAPITGGTITTTGTIGITQAGAASDGYLSSADWTTFNSKQGALTFTAPLVNTSGTITITQSGAATDGYLSSTDWNTFNGKEPALTKGNLTEVTSAVLTITNGTNAVIGSGTSIQVAQSSSTTNGYLSSTDWSTFNGKQDAITLTTTGTSGVATLIGSTLNIPDYTEQYTGTVTSVDLTAGTGISVSGGPITTSGSITVTNNDLGSSQNIFKNIAVAGQSTIVADVNDDTLTVVAGSGVTITTNDTTDTITISATGSGGSVTSVGTSAPITGGTITTTGTIGITQSGAAADGYLSSTDWNTFNNKQNALTNPVTGTGTTNYVPKWTSGSAIGDSAIYDNAGNVGIGTASLGAKLEVDSGSTLPIIRARYNATYYADYDSNGIQFVGAGQNFNITDNGSSVLYLKSGGNVGIGTTAPAVKLHVAGTSTYNSDTVKAFRVSDGTTLTKGVDIGYDTTLGRGFIQAGYFGVSYSDLLLNPNLGNVGIGTTSPAAKLHTVADTAGDDTAAIIEGTGGLGSGLHLKASGTSGRTWRLLSTGTSSTPGAGTLGFYDSTAALYRFVINTSGNVGIGTTAPSTKLEVGDFLDAVTNKITVAARYEYEPEFNFRLGQTGTGYDWIGAVISSGDDGNYNGKILFKTANAGRDTPTTKMVIKASGNVGIGTTAPTAKLYVKGNATDDVGLTVLENDHASGGIYFPTLSVINTRGNHSYGVVAEFRTNTAGDGDRPSILFYGEQAAHSWQIGQTTSDAGWGASDDFAIGYRASNDPTTFIDFPTAYLTVKTGGNVLIGTTTDNGSTLNVNGSGLFSSNLQTNGVLTIGNQSVAGNYILQITPSTTVPVALQGILTGTGTAPISLQASGGNVGIGTTSPGELLDLRRDTNTGSVIRVRNANGGTADYAGLALGNDLSANGGGIIIFGSQSTYSSPYNPDGTYIYSNRPGGISITSEAAAPVYIATNNSIRLYVASAGNVGIGTTSRDSS
jgi:hypothetical protein